jgi:hypothetical protein
MTLRNPRVSAPPAPVPIHTDNNCLSYGERMRKARLCGGARNRAWEENSKMTISGRSVARNGALGKPLGRAGRGKRALPAHFLLHPLLALQRGSWLVLPVLLDQGQANLPDLSGIPLFPHSGYSLLWHISVSHRDHWFSLPCPLLTSL